MSKKYNVIAISIIVLLLIAIASVTYAYFESEIAEAVRSDVVVDIATLEEFTFTTTGDLNINVTPTTLPENGSNLVREASTIVSLKKSNKETNNITKNYYVYLDISNNTFQYTNGTTPEILLNVYLDNNEVTLTGLTQKTQGGVTGYDITTYSGLLKIADPATITSTSSDTATTKNWTFKITFLNLATDQSANIGAVLETYLIVTKEEPTYCYLHPSDLACEIDNTFDGFTNNTMTLANGYLYHHDANLTNGANDGSYRFAGANPNNYICFGSDATTCPADNLYRIIGQIPVDVVMDETDSNNIATESQMLYKIIKNDYLTTAEVSTGSGVLSEMAITDTFDGPSGNQVDNLQGYYWSGAANNQSNTWSNSTLNTIGLNSEYLTNVGNTWSNKIAKVMWKVGGVNRSYMLNTTPMSTVYIRELAESGLNALYAPSDGKNEYVAKVGLMYVTDYGYAAPDTAWNYALTDSYYHDYRKVAIKSINWLYRGVYEFTITRLSDDDYVNYTIFRDGQISTSYVYYKDSYNAGCGIRPTFYLNEDITIDFSHAGTSSDPYRIS